MAPYVIDHYYKWYKYAPVPMDIEDPIGRTPGIHQPLSAYIWYGRVVEVYDNKVVIDHVIFRVGYYFNLKELDFDNVIHLAPLETIVHCPLEKQVILVTDMFEFAGEIPGEPHLP
jgi:hypothetical protein